MKQITLTIMILCLATGCVTVTPGSIAKNVRVTTNAQSVANCAHAGIVQGKDHYQDGHIGQTTISDNAMNELRSQAIQLGANTILLTNLSTNISGAHVSGEAYSCN